MERRLVLLRAVSYPEAVQTSHLSYSNGEYASQYCTSPQFFPEVAIMQGVVHRNGY